jgi:hypothetical protein
MIGMTPLIFSLSGVNTLLYTVPRGYLMQVVSCLFVNANVDGAATVWLYRVPPGDTPDDENILLCGVPVQRYHDFKSWKVLPAGYEIWAYCETAPGALHSVTLNIDGSMRKIEYKT